MHPAGKGPADGLDWLERQAITPDERANADNPDGDARSAR